MVAQQHRGRVIRSRDADVGASASRCSGTATFGNPITRHLRKHVVSAPGLRREHTPRTVIVPEEKECNRTIRSHCLNAYITPPIRGCATESGYPNRRRRSWRQPFFNQRTQGLFCSGHPLLLQPRSRWFSHAPLALGTTKFRPQGIWSIRIIDTGRNPPKQRRLPAQLCVRISNSGR
jgi:hypothetical protein